MTSSDHDPLRYWTERLERSFDERGVGCAEYDVAYNRWLYRAKRRTLDHALAPGGAPGRALDVGSGTGWVVDQLLRRGAGVEGCDLTAVSVAGLRRRFPGVAFFQAALGDGPLPRPDGAYDTLTALDVVYHIVDQDRWRGAVGELARVLRAGGRLVVSDGFGSGDVSPAEHVRLRGLETWREVAAQHGLSLVGLHPMFRWLSRPLDLPHWRRLPGSARGGLEYALERLAPRPAHQSCAVFQRRG